MRVHVACAIGGFDRAMWQRLASSTSHSDARTGVLDRSSITLHHTGGGDSYRVFALASAALLRYQVFPSSRMRYEVCTDDGKVAPGATIVQRVRLGPIVIESAVRVISLIDASAGGERNVAFSYVTLKGHPERGIATFCVRQERATGRVSITIKTWSRPGSWITMAARPLARLIQRPLTRAALASFAASITKAARIQQDAAEIDLPVKA